MVNKTKNILYWGLRVTAVVILLQTLFFKFTAAPESVYIFSKTGMEPWGRIGTGIAELVASILLLFPRTTAFGGVLGLGLMSGALFFHLTVLGIEVQDDSGLLFLYAIVVFVSCLTLVIEFRRQLFDFMVSILRR